MARTDREAAEEYISRSRRQEGLAKKAVGTAAALAAPYTSMGSKLLPFLNKALPTGLAMKGIEKISPELANILKSGSKLGLDVNEGLEFFKDQVTQETNQPAETIKKYSDKLFQFLKNQIGAGRSPLEAGALAQNMKEFKQPIQKMQKDLQRNWSDILTDEFGEGVINKEREQPQESDNWEDTIIQKMQALRSM